MRYFNMKTSHGIETVDQLDQRDFKSYREFKAELRRLKAEYQHSGMDVYISTRCAKNWK